VTSAVDADARLEQLERLLPTAGRPSPDVLAEIKRDADAYEAAFERFAAEGETAKALWIAVRLAWYWLVNGRLAEGQKRLLSLLEADGDVRPNLRAQALEKAATFAFEQGAADEARTRFEESLAASRDADDEVAEATALGGLARCALMAGDLEKARERARACEAIHRARNDEAALDFPRHILAYADYIAGDDDRARTGFEGTLEAARRLGNRRAVGRELTNLCSVETRAGNLERAQALGEEALRTAIEIDNPHLVTYCVINLAGVASARGDHERAAQLFGVGEAMMDSSGMALNPGTAIEHERHVERTRTALGEDEYHAATQAGQNLERDAALTEALSR
jgi:tetratricopeptide (TPR) repeat protein